MTPPTKEQYEKERTGPGRRDSDRSCADHEERLDAMEKQISWVKGAAYTVGAVATILSVVFGWMGNQIYAKVVSIDEKMNKNEIVSVTIVEQYKSLDRRVQIIEDRHLKDSEDRRK